MWRAILKIGKLDKTQYGKALAVYDAKENEELREALEVAFKEDEDRDPEIIRDYVLQKCQPAVEEVETQQDRPFVELQPFEKTVNDALKHIQVGALHLSAEEQEVLLAHVKVLTESNRLRQEYAYHLAFVSARYVYEQFISDYKTEHSQRAQPTCNVDLNNKSTKFVAEHMLQHCKCDELKAWAFKSDHAKIDSKSPPSIWDKFSNKVHLVYVGGPSEIKIPMNDRHGVPALHPEEYQTLEYILAKQNIKWRYLEETGGLSPPYYRPFTLTKQTKSNTRTFNQPRIHKNKFSTLANRSALTLLPGNPQTTLAFTHFAKPVCTAPTRAVWRTAAVAKGQSLFCLRALRLFL